MNPDPNIPATLVDEDGLPMTPFAIDQLRHSRMTAINEKRERLRLRRSNDKKGFEEPKVGQVYFVQLDGSITRRSRGRDPRWDYPGIRFERNKRVEITVVSDEDYEKTKSNTPDANVVTVHGAELIIEDGALHVFETPMSSEDIGEIRQRNTELEEELQLARAEVAKLRQAAAEMKARREAPDSPEGKPNKLAAARAERVAGASTGNEFGAPADPAKK